MRAARGRATTRDGAGVKLTRVLTQNLQRRLDPFLMLDAFGTDNPGDYIGGFPDHPHRGFETVTYMLDGRMRHRDWAGNEGLLSGSAVFEQALPAGHNAFVYAYRGELAVAGQSVPRQRMAILANTPGSDGVRLQGGPQDAHAILIAGLPLNEPIAQYGPFVMSSNEEIFQAVEDFRAGRLA